MYLKPLSIRHIFGIIIIQSVNSNTIFIVTLISRDPVMVFRVGFSKPPVAYTHEQKLRRQNLQLFQKFIYR